MKRRAFISGINGQDGSFMAEELLSRDYEVYGLIRRTSTTGTWRIEPFIDRLRLIPGDMTDTGSLFRAVKLAQPHEVYHFAAQSDVGKSFHEPEHTIKVIAGGMVGLLEALRQMSQDTRLYNASSSEQFGNSLMSPQTEDTPFSPVSPYGSAKTAAHHMAVAYRKSYGMFICCGIAYNHESPRRGEEFVTRKITKAVARIKSGQQDVLYLGDCAAQRDWSHAKDIVHGAWLTLQREVPDDYIFASGETHSVQEFMELAFNYAGISHYRHVKFDPTLLRPTDVRKLQGLSFKATQLLGWKPTVTFSQLVQEMVESDIASTQHRDTVQIN